MQLVDSKLYIANMPAQPFSRFGGRSSAGALGNIISRLKGTSASGRLLALLIAGLLVAGSPALLSTVYSVVSVTFQVLLQAGHVGLIAFQIFAR